MTIDMSQFLETFYEESFEGLEVMETELLDLDSGTADTEIINTIFRAAHSIKGGSGTFGLNDVANFTHVMETLLDEMRDGRREVTQEAVNLLLASVDVLRDMLSSLRAGENLDTERVASAKKELELLLTGSASVESATPVTSVDNSGDMDEGEWKIIFKPFPDMLQTGNDPARIFRELESLGQIDVVSDISKLPSFDQLVPEDCHISWEINLKGNTGRDEIDEVFSWVEGDCDLEIVSLNSDAEAGEKENKSEETSPPATLAKVEKHRKPKTADSGSIRVSIDKIDDLINMMGELVITQSMLNQLGSIEEFGAADFEKLRDGLVQLERNTREMQENIMRIRMLPISFVFQRFPRLIHDLSEKLNKKIELEMSGEQTELDKTVMEKIGDPLVHLVRNSIDHGIESPEERRLSGKNESGVIKLNAFHEGGNIVIEIIDDGAGLNRDKIISKAVQNNIIAEDEILTDEQIYELIFSPGLSTADEVSDVSGRGVGMDVVRRNIRDLGGTVEVSSETNKGSIFTIRLPLTLAIMDGQSVSVGNEIYIIPLVSIVESLQVRSDEIKGVVGKASLYRLRDEYIPIVRLHDVFSIGTECHKLEEGLLVVVEGEGIKIALFIDDLLGQQQVVIKSLETHYKKVKGISGATILGDGTVALIIDVAGLIRLSQTELNIAKGMTDDGSEIAA